MMMIDLKCSQGNAKKFKNETDHCSIQLQELSKQYSNLVDPTEEENKQKSLIAGLLNEQTDTKSQVQESELRNATRKESDNQENPKYRAKCLRATYSEERRLVQIDLNNRHLSDWHPDDRLLEDVNSRYNHLLNRTNCEVGQFDNEPKKDEYANLADKTDMQCSSRTNEDSSIEPSSPADEPNEPGDAFSAETTNQPKAITCSNVPSTSAGPKQPDKQEPFTSALRPTSSRYQEPSPQSHQSQATHSTENHNVHFATKNDKPSSISVGHFSIYLDRLDYEYRPSDTLTGKLHLLLESGQVGLRRIVVYLKGISSVKLVFMALFNRVCYSLQ